jgi:hypothetical protein
MRQSRSIASDKPHFLIALVAIVVLGGSVAAATFSMGAMKRPLTVTTRQSELPAIKSAMWTKGVKVSFGAGQWTFTSTGIPASIFTASHYAVPADPFNVSASGASVKATADILQDQHYSYTLPTTPVYSTTTTANQGPIGLMLDGAVLYNPYEANKSIIATNDNFAVTVGSVSASFLDDCNGHPGPGGQYHYHGVPGCLVAYATTGKNVQVASVGSFSSTPSSGVDESNPAAKKPVLVGFAFDGYGIYDNIDMNGKVIAVTSLDGCNGLFTPVPSYPKGVYHYVLENVKANRASLSCYHGVVSSAYSRARH